MARYINIDDDRNCYIGNDGEYERYNIDPDVLDEAVEIIRCKECKFYTEMRQDLNTGICSLSCRHLGGDGFCSEAERRTDE